MLWVISRYNHDISYLKDYTDDYVIYDRSEIPIEGSIPVRNIGTDWYDKFTFIIDNYDNLPEVAVYTKANIFKYITPEEFELIKDNKTFTPILTQNHKVYSDIHGPVCRYRDGMYEERNNQWYLGQFPSPKHDIMQLMLMLGIADQPYVAFAPGSNYIVPKETILKYPKESYQYLRSLLDYDVYPSEAQVIERGIYNWWK
uniref:Uncharacterized protein n=1 Tax=viral metagenome TaxID=1070528 RepID=A0A6M3Y6S4_9ZZZZ